MRKSFRPVFVALVVIFSVVFNLTSPVFADSVDLQVVATGLNNPRGLAFGPDGALYVAEAGSGGEGPCAPGPEGDVRCYGESGSITRINLKKGTQTRVVTGIPSLAGEGGVAATGIHDIAFQGLGNAYAVIGFGGDPTTRQLDFGPAGAAFDQLIRLKAYKKAKAVDLGAFEVDNNPAGGTVDSNPYAVLALPGKQIVVDAGGNSLLEIKANGEVRTLASFADRLVDAPPFLGLPPGTKIPMQPVPTAVVRGPDGNYYVGELTGFPFPVGGANIYRVPANGGTPEVVATGFTAIVDLAIAPDGGLYVLEIAKNGLLAAFGGGDWTGAVIHVAKDGTQHEVASEGLFAPGGIAVGAHGALFITNNSILSGAGQVLKITP